MPLTILGKRQDKQESEYKITQTPVNKMNCPVTKMKIKGIQ